MDGSASVPFTDLISVLVSLSLSLSAHLRQRLLHDSILCKELRVGVPLIVAHLPQEDRERERERERERAPP